MWVSLAVGHQEFQTKLVIQHRGSCSGRTGVQIAHLHGGNMRKGGRAWKRLVVCLWIILSNSKALVEALAEAHGAQTSETASCTGCELYDLQLTSG